MNGAVATFVSHQQHISGVPPLGHMQCVGHAHVAHQAHYHAPAQDFYNLVDVYLDAVLHPNCVRDPRTFAQEGWHYEVEDLKVRDRRACAAAVCLCVRLAHAADDHAISQLGAALLL